MTYLGNLRIIFEYFIMSVLFFAMHLLRYVVAKIIFVVTTRMSYLFIIFRYYSCKPELISNILGLLATRYWSVYLAQNINI